MYNCNCGCDCNKNIVKTTAIEATGTVLELIIPDMDLKHGQKIRVIFAQTPPVIATPPLRVEVAVNGAKTPVVQDRMVGANGAISFLYSDQLLRDCSGNVRARQYIDLVYSSDTLAFMYVAPCRCLPRANIEFPRNLAPVPPALAGKAKMSESKK